MVDTTDGAEVRLGADTGDATSGMASAANSIAASLAAIQAALDKFGTGHRGTVNRAIQNNASLSRSFLEMKASAQNGFNGVIGVIERFRGVLGTLAAAIAGGFLFTKSVEAMLSLEDAVRGLSIGFGMTAEKATLLATNLKLAGVSTETYETMGMRLSMRLRLQSDEFTRLGVTIKDAKGNFLPLDQIMHNVYSRMQDFKAGTDQDLFVMDLMGRRAKDFASDMQRIGNTTERAAQLVKELGISMDESEQNKIENYRVELHAFGVVLDHIGEEIGKEVVGSLEELARWFTANKDGISAVTTVIKVLSTAIVGLGFVINALRTLLDQSATTWEKWGQEALFSLNVVSGHYADAAVAWNKAEELKKHESSKTWDAIIDQARRASETMVNIWKGASNQAVLATQDALRLMRQGEAASYGPTKKPGTEAFTEKPTGEDTRLAQWKETLDQMKEAEGYFHNLSYAEEAAYWTSKLALVKGNGDKEVALRREIAHLIYEANKEGAVQEYQDSMALYANLIEAASENKDKQLALAHDRVEFVRSTYKDEGKEVQAALAQETKLREEWAKKEEALIKDAAKFHIEMLKEENAQEDAALNQQVAMHQITVQQKIAAEKQMTTVLYEEELKQQDEYIATLTIGTKAWQDALQDRQKMMMQYNAKITELSYQAQLDQTQYARQAADTIDNAFTTMLDNFAMNTQKASKTWQDFVKQLTSGLTSIAAKQVGQQLFGPSTQAGGMINSLTSKLFGGAAGAAGGTAQATAEAANTLSVDALTISTNALALALTANTAALSAQSAAGAFSATQGGGISSLFSGGNSFLSGLGIPGFDSGTPYVPQTSLAIVHRGERIVPASQNQSYAFGGTRNNFMINGPIDTRTMAQISRQSAKAANRARRQG